MVVLEFQNGTDGDFSMATGSTLYDVLINKTGGDKSSYQMKERKGNRWKIPKEIQLQSRAIS